MSTGLIDAAGAVQKVVAFLETARTALDSGELALVGALTSDNPAHQLAKSRAMFTVAARNVEFAAGNILEVGQKIASEASDGASVDGVSAGRTVVPTEKVGRDQVPSSAASAAKHAP